MSIEFNHTLVDAKDIWAAAREVGGVLDLAEPSSYGPFAVLQFDNGVTLDFIEDTGESRPSITPSWSARRTLTPSGTGSRGRGASGGPTRTSDGQGRSTTETAAAASTGKVGTPLARDHHPPVRQRRLRPDNPRRISGRLLPDSDGAKHASSDQTKSSIEEDMRQ